MSERTRVLVVEDNPADVDLMREALPKTGPIQFHIESVPRLSEAVARLVTGEIDVVLIDLGLPDSQGLATLQKLRQAAPDLAMVVLTGYDDMETAVAAVREGAQEYLVKGQFSRNLLVRTVRYAIERKRTESRERLARKVLDLLNRPDDVTQSIGDILQLIKTSMDFEAVAIRLQVGEDFPYYVADGFSEGFLCAERFLCERDEAGGIVRDATGNPVLECMCGNVLRGRTNCALPFFTEGGSSWSNNTSALLASTIEADRQARTRNRCNSEGYESVALVPLRSRGEIIGLLQLNDRRPDRFTLGMIRFLEGLSASIGIALARKKAEERTQDSERQYRELVQNANSAIIRWRCDGAIMFFNEYAQAFFGYSADEALGKHVGILVPEKESSGRDLTTLVQDIVKHPERYINNINENVCRDGRRVWVAWTNKPIFDDCGQVAEILAVGSDITERKQAEDQVRHLNRVLRAVRDVNQLIVHEKNSERLIQDACNLLVEQRGYGGALIILTDEAGTPRAYAQAGLEEVFGPLADSLRQGVLPPCCEGARQHDGVFSLSERTIVCGPCPIVRDCVASNSMCVELKHEDTTYGYLSVAMERALGASDEELSLFAEMAGDIAFALHAIELERRRRDMEVERRDMEARILQQQRLESLGTLAGGVAHEINNPINGIMNYAQLILDEQDEGSPSREFAAEIVRETERIALIVRNLLTFARHEKQSRSPARLKDIVDGVLSLIQTVIRHDQIAIEVRIPDGLPRLLCRTQQIQQVLMNLMTNARDALNARFPGHDADKVMMLEAHTFDKEGRTWMRITVEDHGVGISNEQREHLFDPFFTSKPKGIGTGLGLSISHGIVTEHGGQITFESEPNKYTRFFVDLPTKPGDSG